MAAKMRFCDQLSMNVSSSFKLKKEKKLQKAHIAYYEIMHGNYESKTFSPYGIYSERLEFGQWTHKNMTETEREHTNTQNHKQLMGLTYTGRWNGCARSSKCFNEIKPGSAA